jgi:hypothetical protein
VAKVKVKTSNNKLPKKLFRKRKRKLKRNLWLNLKQRFKNRKSSSLKGLKLQASNPRVQFFQLKRSQKLKIR